MAIDDHFLSTGLRAVHGDLAAFENLILACGSEGQKAEWHRLMADLEHLCGDAAGITSAHEDELAARDELVIARVLRRAGLKVTTTHKGGRLGKCS